MVDIDIDSIDRVAPGILCRKAGMALVQDSLTFVSGLLHV